MECRAEHHIVRCQPQPCENVCMPLNFTTTGEFGGIVYLRAETTGMKMWLNCVFTGKCQSTKTPRACTQWQAVISTGCALLNNPGTQAQQSQWGPSAHGVRGRDPLGMVWWARRVIVRSSRDNHSVLNVDNFLRAILWVSSFPGCDSEDGDVDNKLHITTK